MCDIMCHKNIAMKYGGRTNQQVKFIDRSPFFAQPYFFNGKKVQCFKYRDYPKTFYKVVERGTMASRICTVFGTEF